MGGVMEVKLNPAYKEAQQTDARYRILYGGAGSGKSHYVAQETILNMVSSGHFNYLIVRKTDRSIRNSVFRSLVDMISEMNLMSLFRINRTEMTITSATGSSIITSGLDDVEKLKSIANINRIWVEEASEITEADFNQLDLRIRGHSPVGHQMTLTFNPISELHWLKKSFFDMGRPDSFILKTTYKDNKFLDDKYIATLHELERQDEQYYRIYALGEWGSVGNMIFSNWRKEDLSDTKHTFDNLYNGLDFGFADDPTAYIKVHLDNKRKKIYVIDEFAKAGLHIDQIASELNNHMPNEIVTCDSSEPRSIADLKRHGIKAYAAKKGAGSVEHGIRWLQGYEIIVDESCINTLSELSSYKWKETKDGQAIPKPEDKNNHIIDALRYALESEMAQNRMTVQLFKHGI